MKDEVKFCKGCKTSQPRKCFSKNAKSPDGLYTYCKTCCKQREIERRLNNPEKEKARYKKYKQDNKISVSDYNAKYYLIHEEEIRAHHKKRYNENPTKSIEQAKEWIKNHPKQAAETKRRNHQKRFDTDPAYRLLCNYRCRVVKILNGGTKEETTKELIGCSLTKWREWLEKRFYSNISWENYGDVWHVDHVIPLIEFDMTDSVQRKAAFHYTNTQPLLWFDNLSKGAKLNWIKE